jgi:pyruvate-ferredoxin/flavodoxin oxidoreductase
VRKEISLIGMAHRTSYVMSGTIAHVNHLIESYIDGLNSRRPALFNIYAVCPPEHGVGDDKSVDQSKLAVEGRAYPLFRFDPDAGTTFAECVSLEGNPSLDTDWPTYTLKYRRDRAPSRAWTLPMTFADFAATEARFLKHFRKAPPETWNDSMVPVAEFLELDPTSAKASSPSSGRGQEEPPDAPAGDQGADQVGEERLHFWRQLRGLAGAGAEAADAAEVEGRVREELLAKISAALGQGGAVARRPAPESALATRRIRGRRRRLRAGLDRIARVHGLRRVHHAGAEDLRLQRAEAGRGHQSEGLEVRRHRQGRREMHGRLHPSRHALEHERAGRREAHGKGRQIQLSQ